MENVLFRDKYFLFSCLFMLETITHKKFTRKKIRKQFQFYIDYESSKYMLGILFLKIFQHAHHNCCNLKLVISYSILS